MGNTGSKGASIWRAFAVRRADLISQAGTRATQSRATSVGSSRMGFLLVDSRATGAAGVARGPTTPSSTSSRRTALQLSVLVRTRIGLNSERALTLLHQTLSLIAPESTTCRSTSSASALQRGSVPRRRRTWRASSPPKITTENNSRTSRPYSIATRPSSSVGNSPGTSPSSLPSTPPSPNRPHFLFPRQPGLDNCF